MHLFKVPTKPIPFPEFVVLMAMISSLVAFSVDAMLPALPFMREDLGIQVTYDGQLIIAALMFGLGVGQLFFGPLTDRFGRRPIFAVGCVLFVLGSIVCLLAGNLTVMVIGRLIQGLGAAAPRICSQAMIRDQYQGEAMARVMSLTSMIFIIIPMIAPAFGQWILLVSAWKGIFLVIMMMSVVATLWLLLRQPETLAPEKQRSLNIQAVRTAAFDIIRNPRVLGCIFAMGCNFGAFLAYLGTSEKLLIGLYDVGQQFALLFALLAFAIGLASFTNASLVMRLGMPKLIRTAQSIILVFSLLLTIVWSMAEGLPPLWISVAIMMVVLFGVGILFGNLSALAMQPLGDMAGLGAAIIGFLSSVISVVLSIVIAAFMLNDYTPVALGFSVCALGGMASIRWALKHDKNRQAPKDS